MSTMSATAISAATVRWPGHIKPATEVKAMLSHLDVLPLCLAVSGAPHCR